MGVRAINSPLLFTVAYKPYLSRVLTIGFNFWRVLWAIDLTQYITHLASVWVSDGPNWGGGITLLILFRLELINICVLR